MRLPGARPHAATGRNRLYLLAAAAVVFPFCPAAHSLAAGTPAGTVIDNAADVSFDVGGVNLSLTSNTVSITVDERIDIVVTLQSAQVLAGAGDTGRGLLFRVTNTGNGSESVRFAIDSMLAGDDFDPVPAVPAVYFDSDASGDLSIGDVAYVPGGNEPVLAADASVDVLLVNDIPGTATNGDVGLCRIVATAATGSGVPGDLFAGQGDSGTDAVIGTTGGESRADGEYLVGDVQAEIVKSVIVADPFGGTQPIPGATLTYTVTVQVTNAGTAGNSTVRDAVPANTTYLPSSLMLNGVPLTDPADGDAGELDTSGAPTIVVRLGDLTQASGAQTVEFAVTVD